MYTGYFKNVLLGSCIIVGAILFTSRLITKEIEEKESKQREETKRRKDEEAKQRKDGEAKRRKDEEAKRRKDEEAKRRKDEETRRREETKQREDEETRRREETKQGEDKETRRIEAAGKDDIRKKTADAANLRANVQVKHIPKGLPDDIVVMKDPPDDTVAKKIVYDYGPDQRFYDDDETSEISTEVDDGIGEKSIFADPQLTGYELSDRAAVRAELNRKDSEKRKSRYPLGSAVGTIYPSTLPAGRFAVDVLSRSERIYTNAYRSVDLFDRKIWTSRDQRFGAQLHHDQFNTSSLETNIGFIRGLKNAFENKYRGNIRHGLDELEESLGDPKNLYFCLDEQMGVLQDLVMSIVELSKQSIVNLAHKIALDLLEEERERYKIYKGKIPLYKDSHFTGQVIRSLQFHDGVGEILNEPDPYYKDVVKARTIATEYLDNEFNDGYELRRRRDTNGNPIIIPGSEKKSTSFNVKTKQLETLTTYQYEYDKYLNLDPDNAADRYGGTKKRYDRFKINKISIQSKKKGYGKRNRRSFNQRLKRND